MVVGDELFGVGIHAGSTASYVDWRSDYDSLTYSLLDLPGPVIAGLRAFLAEFDLRYGAFDFVIGPGVDGERTYTFLECNPGGQFGWLEQAGVPITASVVDLLTKGCDE